MRDKKKMIAIGGAALALIATAGVAVTLVHKNSEPSDEGMINLVENVGNDRDDRPGKNREIEGLDFSGYRIPELSNGWSDGRSDESRMDEELSDPSIPKVINRGHANPESEKLLLGESVLLSGENEQEPLDEEDSEEDICVVTPIQTNGYKEHEVICDAQSEEEAEYIANAISGTLLLLDQGTAVIQIEESVDELLARLEQEGSTLRLYRHYNFVTQN